MKVPPINKWKMIKRLRKRYTIGATRIEESKKRYSRKRDNEKIAPHKLIEGTVGDYEERRRK